MLYQLPCYVPLRSEPWGIRVCTVVLRDLHGAECSTCAKEGYLRLPDVAEGQDGARRFALGVMRGEFESIDLNDRSDM